MALIQYSNFVSDMSGKLNGSVHASNRGGQYTRTKITPRNPATPYQQAARNSMGQLAKDWGSLLTDAQRAAWSAYGATSPVISPFGNPKPLAGNTAFTSVNRIVLQAGGTMLLDPPVSKAITGLTSLTLTANHTGPVLTVTFAPTPLSSPEGIYLFATPAFSPGISNSTTMLRFLNYYSAASSVLDIESDWVARFGTFPASAGQRIAILAQVVNNTTGAISTALGTGTLIS